MKTRQDPAAKPYYRCLSCGKFRKACGGIPTRDLDLQGWCEYMRDVKEITHLTNDDIAKQAEVSKKTVEKIMALNYDKMREFYRIMGGFIPSYISVKSPYIAVYFLVWK